MQVYTLTVTPTITSEPIKVEVLSTSREKARDEYYNTNPTHFVIECDFPFQEPDYEWLNDVARGR